MIISNALISQSGSVDSPLNKRGNLEPQNHDTRCPPKPPILFTSTRKISHVRRTDTYITIGICSWFVPCPFEIVHELPPLRIRGRQPALKCLPVNYMAIFASDSLVMWLYFSQRIEDSFRVYVHATSRGVLVFVLACENGSRHWLML